MVSIDLANGRGSTGAIVIFNYASQVFNSVPLMIATRRLCGPAAMRGIGHATLAALAAGATSAAVGAGICLAVPASGKLIAAGMAVIAAGGAVIAFGAVAYALDRGDLKAVTARLRRPRSQAAG